MQFYVKFIRPLKKLISIGIISLFFCGTLSAWTIQVLNPANVLSTRDVLTSNSFTTFKGYLEDTQSVLTSGSLSGYTIGSSDAVIVNLVSLGASYTANEITVLTNLLNSGTRVLVFGEHNSWRQSNQQIATIVGGDYKGASLNNTQNMISGAFPLITNGVNSVYFDAPGKTLPIDDGILLTDDAAITLWGNSENFLFFMDINALSDEIARLDNNQLALNIADWLAGSTIPEPSTYTLISGFVLLGGFVIRRKRS